MPPEPDDFTRPDSLAAVASRSATLSEFGQHLQDWLHTLRGLSTRASVLAAIEEAPARLAARFADGDAADAWLAACAESISRRLNAPAPPWAFAPERFRAAPWFADSAGGPAVRRAALLYSPLPFKRRNLYAAHIDIPLRVRAGRPSLPLAHKRQTNAARQRRFRARRAAELKHLRTLAGLPPAPPVFPDRPSVN